MIKRARELHVEGRKGDNERKLDRADWCPGSSREAERLVVNADL